MAIKLQIIGGEEPGKQSKAGRQHLVHLTVEELVKLVRPGDEIAVSQASLRKIIGDAGVDALLAKDKRKV